MKRPKWGNWCKQARLKADMTMREVAKAADVDPSYLTLVERDGYVPKLDVAVRLTEALVLDKKQQDLGMIIAGYAPRNVTFTELSEALDYIYKARNDGKPRTRGKSTRLVP